MSDYNLSPGEPRFGLWCEDCQSFSGVEETFIHRGADGDEVIATLLRCKECRGYRVTDPD